jgi:hypothetical protein
MATMAATTATSSPLAARAPLRAPRGLGGALPCGARARRSGARKVPAPTTTTRASVGAFAAGGPASFNEGAQTATWLAGQLLASGAAVAAFLAYEAARARADDAAASHDEVRARHSRRRCSRPCAAAARAHASVRQPRALARAARRTARPLTRAARATTGRGRCLPGVRGARQDGVRLHALERRRRRLRHLPRHRHVRLPRLPRRRAATPHLGAA